MNPTHNLHHIIFMKIISRNIVKIAYVSSEIAQSIVHNLQCKLCVG